MLTSCNVVHCIVIVTCIYSYIELYIHNVIDSNANYRLISKMCHKSTLNANECIEYCIAM